MQNIIDTDFRFSSVPPGRVLRLGNIQSSSQIKLRSDRKGKSFLAAQKNRKMRGSEDISIFIPHERDLLIEICCTSFISLIRTHFEYARSCNSFPTGVDNQVFELRDDFDSNSTIAWHFSRVSNMSWTTRDSCQIVPLSLFPLDRAVEPDLHVIFRSLGLMPDGLFKDRRVIESVKELSHE